MRPGTGEKTVLTASEEQTESEISVERGVAEKCCKVCVCDGGGCGKKGGGNGGGIGLFSVFFQSPPLCCGVEPVRKWPVFVASNQRGKRLSEEEPVAGR